MASFLGRCCIISAIIIATFGVVLQLIVILNNWSMYHLVYRTLVSYCIYRARSTSLLTLSPTAVYHHNLCINQVTNKTVSCELVGYNLLFKYLLPDMKYTRYEAPETFITTLRNEYTNTVKYAPPFGTIYEYLTIHRLKCLLVHSNVQNKGNHKELFSNGIILYFHGGGFVVGSAFANHKFLSYLHLFSDLPVLGIDYKLAPEYLLYDTHFLNDADVIITDYLHNELDVEYNKIYLIGDSAGGAVALMITQHFSFVQNFPNFGGTVLISAPVNLTYNEVSENEQYDAMLSQDSRYLFKSYQYGCRNANGEYVEGGIDYSNVDECIQNGNRKMNDRQLNLISNDWSRIKGNMVFIACEYELLLDHSKWGHKKALDNEIHSELYIIPNASLHVLPIFVDIPEAMQWVSNIGQIIKHWNK